MHRFFSDDQGLKYVKLFWNRYDTRAYYYKKMKPSIKEFKWTILDPRVGQEQGLQVEFDNSLGPMVLSWDFSTSWEC